MSEQPEETFIGEAEPGVLSDVHSVHLTPWPGLRWVHIKGQRIAVKPAPVADLASIRQQVDEALAKMPDHPMAWSEVLDVVLSAAGVPGLLDEADRLTQWARDQDAEMESVGSQANAIAHRSWAQGVRAAFDGAIVGQSPDDVLATNPYPES